MWHCAKVSTQPKNLVFGPTSPYSLEQAGKTPKWGWVALWDSLEGHKVPILATQGSTHTQMCWDAGGGGVGGASSPSTEIKVLGLVNGLRLHFLIIIYLQNCLQNCEPGCIA